MADALNNNPGIPEAESYPWETHIFTDKAVLCFIRENARLLLIHKKRGLGAGKINGPGGRIEPGETAAEAAVRETFEEVGLIPASLEEKACLSFLFLDGYSLSVTVFTAADYSGELCETEEALPFWCPESGIPFERMWADDILWLPLVLAGNYVRGYFIFDADIMRSRKIIVDKEPRPGS